MKRRHNQGFSLIELLIAMTILSIVMVMVVQFMSTTSGAYRKNKKNLNLQTDTMQIMEQMSDILMQAQYVQIETSDEGMYILKSDSNKGSRPPEVSLADDDPNKAVKNYPAVNYALVPDNYGNYCKALNYVLEKRNDERKVVVDMNTYEETYDVTGKKLNKLTYSGDYKLYDAKSGEAYPITGDKGGVETVTDGAGHSSAIAPKSLRILKVNNDMEDTSTYRYVRPRYIYAEYYQYDEASSKEKTVHVCYYISNVVDDRDKTCAIYMLRYVTDRNASIGMDVAKEKIKSAVGNSHSRIQKSNINTNFSEEFSADSGGGEKESRTILDNLRAEATISALTGMDTISGGLVTE